MQIKSFNTLMFFFLFFFQFQIAPREVRRGVVSEKRRDENRPRVPGDQLEQPAHNLRDSNPGPLRQRAGPGIRGGIHDRILETWLHVVGPMEKQERKTCKC